MFDVSTISFVLKFIARGMHYVYLHCKRHVICLPSLQEECTLESIRDSLSMEKYSSAMLCLSNNADLLFGC